MLLPTLALATDSTSNNNTERGVNKAKEGMLERLKELKLQGDKIKRETEIREKLKALDLSRKEVSNFAFSTEIPLSTLLIPLIKETEQKEINTEWEKMHVLKQTNFGRTLELCRLYSDVPTVPTAYPHHYPQRVTKRSGDGVGWLAVGGGPTHAFIKNKALRYVDGFRFTVDNDIVRPITDMDSLSHAIGRKVDTPAKPVRCIYFYAKLGEAVINKLTRVSVAVDGEPTRKQSLFVGGNLHQAVKDALLEARYGPNRYNPYPDVDEFANREIEKGCKLPTLVGIQSNAVDWQCGGLTVDPNSLTATLGGMPILGGNTFFGKKITLIQVDTLELAKAHLTSERLHVSKTESSE